MTSSRFVHRLTLALAVAAITFSLAVRAQAQTETVLYNFATGYAGNYPDGTVVLDGAGNIYGSTQFGASCCGTVYELSPVSGGGWTYKVLKGFSNSSYGSYVSPTLVRDAAGPNVFFLGCNTPQNMRVYGGSFGLLDAMRIGPDNGTGWDALIRDRKSVV